MSSEAPIELPEPRRGTGALRLVAEDIAQLAEAVRLLEHRQRMGTIRPSPGVRPQVRDGGTVLGIDFPIPSTELLPFECRVTTREVTPNVFKSALVAAPGTITTPDYIIGANKPETVEVDAADGTWYFWASVTINTTTGAVTGTAVGWDDTPPVSSGGTYYKYIASVEIVDGAPVVAPGLLQFDYGPILFVLAGGLTDVWTVFFF